jgi:hypothetical protein
VHLHIVSVTPGALTVVDEIAPAHGGVDARFVDARRHPPPKLAFGGPTLAQSGRPIDRFFTLSKKKPIGSILRGGGGGILTAAFLLERGIVPSVQERLSDFNRPDDLARWPGPLE